MFAQTKYFVTVPFAFILILRHHFSNAFHFHADETRYSKHSIALLTASCTILYIVCASCFFRLMPKTLMLNSMFDGSSAHAL